MTFEDTVQKVVGIAEWLEGWAVNKHQRNDDEGLAAIARLAGKFGAVLRDPANAADIAAIGRMAAQDLPSLAAPAPMPLDAPQPDIQDGARGGSRGGLMAPGT